MAVGLLGRARVIKLGLFSGGWDFCRTCSAARSTALYQHARIYRCRKLRPNQKVSTSSSQSRVCASKCMKYFAKLAHSCSSKLCCSLFRFGPHNELFIPQNFSSTLIVTFDRKSSSHYQSWQLRNFRTFTSRGEQASGHFLHELSGHRRSWTSLLWMKEVPSYCHCQHNQYQKYQPSTSWKKETISHFVCQSQSYNDCLNEHQQYQSFQTSTSWRKAPQQLQSFTTSTLFRKEEPWHNLFQFRNFQTSTWWKKEASQQLENFQTFTSWRKEASGHYLYQLRSFQTFTSWRKDESKVEKTVKALKESPSEKKDVVAPKKSLWKRFVGVLVHYYHGFRLLGVDMKISIKLLWKLLRGKSLTRREHNQLVRTTADMFRLVPLLVFIIVPFAEFLLPFVLILFPNILPSTFQDPNDEKEKSKKRLKAKLEMAKFLQKTVRESAVESKDKDGQTVEKFAQFMDKIRTAGTKPDTKDIMKFAKLFEDEITLDNLTRSQLRACCTMLSVTPIGTDALLRYLLQMKLRSLRADDKVIQKEGVESMTVSELQAANRARGMRALGVSEERLRYQLKQWLELHLEKKIPTSLLLLSRALYHPETMSTEEKLGATITQLAGTAADEAKIKVAEMSGEMIDNKTRLEVIKQEEAIIAAEEEQLAKEAKLLEERFMRDIEEGKAAEVAMATRLLDPAKSLEISHDEILVDRAPSIKGLPKEALSDDKAKQITAKDLGEIEGVLEQIAKERGLSIEHNMLKGLKDEVRDYKEDLEDLKDVAATRGEGEKHYEESLAARHLAKKVDLMISRLDSKMLELQDEKTNIQEKMSKAEKAIGRGQEDTAQLHQEKMDKYKSNLISINDMIDALTRLKKVPNDSKLHEIIRVLDQDKDGKIDINDALKVLEHLSQEHLKLNTNQLEEVLNLLRHEAAMEEEERRKEKEEKMNGKKQNQL